MSLHRSMGMLEATAANVLCMVGVGPFLTLPLMLTQMGGPHIIYAWVLSGVLALLDGLVYAHFAAALPGSGGSLVYLREAYRPLGIGRFMAFLFIFQTLLVAPLTIASGAVGFADYLAFYWPTMPGFAHPLVAAGVCLLMTALLYRNIESVGRLSIGLLVGVGVTIGWVILGGLPHFSLAQAFTFPPAAYRLDHDLLTRMCAVALLAMYNYGGYNNVCNLGEEVRNPSRILPRAIVLSILLVGSLYIIMSTVIIGSMPWHEVAQTSTIASIFIQRTVPAGAAGWAGALMNALILVVTAASLYAVILGYSRIPFAAARDGEFFPIFARLHPRDGFPHVSLLTIGLISIPFCFLPLGDIVSWLLLVEIVSQFVWQCAGVLLLRQLRKDVPQPFVMWLYPLPAVLSLALWSYLFVTADPAGQWFSAIFMAVCAVAWLLFRRLSSGAAA